jgi:hypothetical protein
MAAEIFSAYRDRERFMASVESLAVFAGFLGWEVFGSRRWYAWSVVSGQAGASSRAQSSLPLGFPYWTTSTFSIVMSPLSIIP